MDSSHPQTESKYVLVASQSAQCELPGTRDRIAWIELVSTELLTLDLALPLSFACNTANSTGSSTAASQYISNQKVMACAFSWLSVCSLATEQQLNTSDCYSQFQQN
jgi:hypothetical protein